MDINNIFWGIIPVHTDPHVPAHMAYLLNTGWIKQWKFREPTRWERFLCFILGRPTPDPWDMSDAWKDHLQTHADIEALSGVHEISRGPHKVSLFSYGDLKP